MQLIVDQRRPLERLAGSDQPSSQWFSGPDTAPARPSVEDHVPAYSYASDCECPDDCLRDHENE